MNVIDKCWRQDTNWRNHRQRLARCSVGFAGKMTNNIGKGTIRYIASNVIIHGIQIHHCKAQGPMDGDAIGVVNASKVWIDHNTLYSCDDGLLDVTGGSKNVTISNNWFKNQEGVMLLGHDDSYLRDQQMKVTIVLNRFRPNCNQRMPRVRYGYAHVVNNLYQGWKQYAIGGSMHPIIKSESNDFIAPQSGNKKVTWRKGVDRNSKPWTFYSVNDLFENGAYFKSTGKNGSVPSYNNEQKFHIAKAKIVKTLTSSAGALKCSKALTC
ncbi:unnamed protein product [Linum tenue]|uniref:Pectate lyase n=1 Tax=Linum tenue TaxID=586396 RepID=A0AAV0IS99_9ROSI|nr:unnamed protein product [Linum tenue]